MEVVKILEYSREGLPGVGGAERSEGGGGNWGGGEPPLQHPRGRVEPPRVNAAERRAAEARPATSYQAKGWHAQLRELTGSRRRSELADRPARSARREGRDR